jgi:hypothetical protein
VLGCKGSILLAIGYKQLRAHPAQPGRRADSGVADRDREYMPAVTAGQQQCLANCNSQSIARDSFSPVAVL